MSRSVGISLKLDLRYVKWNQGNNNTSANGQAEWTVDPTLTIIPQDSSVTLTWTLNSTNEGGASVRFSGLAGEAAGIVWKNSTSNPGAVTRVSDTKCQLSGYNTRTPRARPTGATRSTWSSPRAISPRPCPTTRTSRTSPRTPPSARRDAGRHASD
jgi:hypothetical protein